MTERALDRGRWWRSHRWWRRSLAIGAVVVLVVNAMALFHARAMTQFVDGGVRTGPPERLSVWEKAKTLLLGVRVPRPTIRKTPAQLGLPFTRETIDGALAAWSIPYPRPRAVALLFPPYAGAKDSLLPAAAAFHRLGYATVLVDFLGVGESPGNVTTLGVREADQVAAAFRWAKARWPKRPIVLYGASMGAAAVLRAVAVRGIAPEAILVESSFDRLVSTVRHRFEAMGLPGSPGAELIVFWGGVLRRIDGFGHNPATYAASLRIPTLVLHGGCDRRVTEAESRAIFKALRGQKRFVVLDSTGHGAGATDDTTAWERAAVTILEGITRREDRSNAPSSTPGASPPAGLRARRPDR